MRRLRIIFCGAPLANLCSRGSGLVSEYSPRAVKKSVTGYGGAEKTQVQFMVKQLLKLDCVLSEDAADALALAIFCASTVRTQHVKKESV